MTVTVRLGLIDAVRAMAAALTTKTSFFSGKKIIASTISGGETQLERVASENLLGQKNQIASSCLRAKSPNSMGVQHLLASELMVLHLHFQDRCFCTTTLSFRLVGDLWFRGQGGASHLPSTRTTGSIYISHQSKPPIRELKIAALSSRVTGGAGGGAGSAGGGGHGVSAGGGGSAGGGVLWSGFCLGIAQ